jgi:hypothetical protein
MTQEPQQLLKRKTFEQVKQFASEKGITLTREYDCEFRKNGRYTNRYTTTWYTLSSCPDEKFPLLNDVMDYLFPKVKRKRDVLKKEIVAAVAAREKIRAAEAVIAEAAAAVIRAREAFFPKGAPPPVTADSPFLYRLGAELRNKWKENYSHTAGGNGNALAYTDGYFFKLTNRGDIRHYEYGSQIELTPTSLTLRTEQETWEFQHGQVPDLCPSDEESAIEVWDAFSACLRRLLPTPIEEIDAVYSYDN